MRTGLLAASVVAVVVAVSGLLLAGGSGSSSPSSSKSAKTNTVEIKDFKYEPQTVEIKAGTKISFTNEDSAKHTATSKPQGAFDSGDLTKGQTKPVAFEKPGVFKYYCVYHAFMTGTVKVVK